MNSKGLLTMKPLLFPLLFMTMPAVEAQEEALALIPQPVEARQSTGAYELKEDLIIGCSGPGSRPVADMLARRIQVPTGFAVTARQGAIGDIFMRILETPDAKVGNEGYTLEVTPAGVTISANQPAGLFYGAQTLLQLLPGQMEGTVPAKTRWIIPAVSITDYPRFGWRGILLDVSRHFFSKEDVKRYIDRMAQYKYNTLHWHLTDDEGWRIEIKALPRLTEVGAWRVPRTGHFGDRAAPAPGEAATYGGFYTQEDIKEVVAFARERFVTIVPEIDVPGHSMAALAAYPELSCNKDTNTRVNPGARFAEWYGNGTFKMLIENALNPSDERVYAFLEKVFGEVAALFPGPYIHVGGDECYKGYWAQDAGCTALMKKLNIRHVEDLQGYFMGRVGGILKTRGKKLIGWDEILDGGITPDATVMSWRGVRGGIQAAEMGHSVVMTPSTHVYLDYNQGESTVEPPVYASLRVKKSYGFEPVPEGVEARYILGGQGNLWTEQIPTLRHAEYMTYPRAWALAEVYWSPKEKRNWGAFARRMERHFERSEIAGVNYSRAVYDAVVRTGFRDGLLVVEMETELPDVDIFYTIDDTMPDHRCSRYTGPVEIPGGPVTLRVITCRNGKPVGHLITLKREELEKRAVR
jgi:hexosaminidase